MNLLNPEKDPLGSAAFDYFRTRRWAIIHIESDIAANDTLPVRHLFREEEELPELERQALELCDGKILDVGAGAGCHSLILSKEGKEVISLEHSELCCRLMKERGLHAVIHENFFDHRGSKYDTLLFLMNGIGIAGNIHKLPLFLTTAYRLLNPGGKLIFDSSDIRYLFEEGGEFVPDPDKPYYGEMKYRMRYGDTSGEFFDWLFIDFGTLVPIAKKYGFEATLLATGEHYDYLGMLKKTPEKD